MLQTAKQMLQAASPQTLLVPKAHNSEYIVCIYSAYTSSLDTELGSFGIFKLFQ